MSYYIDKDTVKTNFGLPKDQITSAYNSLMSALNAREKLNRIKKEDYESALTLPELMLACRWKPTLDQNGAIIGLECSGVKVAEEDLLFEALAPYVVSGSFVEYIREGYQANEKHRFEFYNGVLNKKEWWEDLDQNLNEYWEEVKC